MLSQLPFSCVMFVAVYRIKGASPPQMFYKIKDYQHGSVSLPHQLNKFARPLWIGCQEESQSVTLKWLMMCPVLMMW